MGEAEIERLDELLNQHINTIHQTLKVLDQPPPSSQTKVSWDEVVKLGEELHKQATAVGILKAGEGADAKALEESIVTYSDLLHKFILLSHGSMIGAGTTLYNDILFNVKKVIEWSVALLQESVASYGNKSKGELSIPELVDFVCKDCSSLKETPRTNVTAICGSMTDTTVEISDVLREMKKYEAASSGPSAEVSKPDNDTNDNDNSSERDYDTKDMKITELAIEVVSGTLSTIEETINSITSLFKNPQTQDENNQTVETLEKLLDISDRMGSLVDDIGECYYLPSEYSAVRDASEKMVSFVGELQEQLEIINGSSVAFIEASNGLKSSLTQLELALGCSDDDDEDELVTKMKENLEFSLPLD